MLKDRGNMKWTAMMLPEHLIEIRKWKEEQFHDKKRELTEWEFEEIEHIIQRAYKQQTNIKLSLWDNNKLHEVNGIITGVDTFKKELLLETDFSIKRIPFEELQKAYLVDTDD